MLSRRVAQFQSPSKGRTEVVVGQERVRKRRGEQDSSVSVRLRARFEPKLPYGKTLTIKQALLWAMYTVAE